MAGLDGRELRRVDGLRPRVRRVGRMRAGFLRTVRKAAADLRFTTAPHIRDSTVSGAEVRPNFSHARMGARLGAMVSYPAAQFTVLVELGFALRVASAVGSALGRRGFPKL